MRPWADHQILVRIALCAHRVEIANRTVEEDVIPTTDVKRWNVRHLIRWCDTHGILKRKVFAACNCVGHRLVELKTGKRSEMLNRNLSISRLNQLIIFTRHRG